jgi:hypothetical protein
VHLCKWLVLGSNSTLAVITYLFPYRCGSSSKLQCLPSNNTTEYHPTTFPTPSSCRPQIPPRPPPGSNPMFLPVRPQTPPPASPLMPSARVRRQHAPTRACLPPPRCLQFRQNEAPAAESSKKRSISLYVLAGVLLQVIKWVLLYMEWL